MKKYSFTVLSLILSATLLLSGCTTATAQKTSASGQTPSVTATVLKVEASATPHAEILDFIKPVLEKEGIKLEVTVLSEGGFTPLERLESGDFDVHFSAHLPALLATQKSKPELADLVSAGAIHVEPIGFYSDKYTSKSSIPDNATIAVPNDTSNEYRALRVLAQNGFVKLKDGISTYTATAKDIVQYVKPIKIVEMDSQLIIRNRAQFDGYITNTNKVIEAKLDPNKVLFREDPKSPFANILIVKKSRVNDAAIKKLYAAMTTPEVKKFIEDKYKGSVVPVF